MAARRGVPLLLISALFAVGLLFQACSTGSSSSGSKGATATTTALTASPVSANPSGAESTPVMAAGPVTSAASPGAPQNARLVPAQANISTVGQLPLNPDTAKLPSNQYLADQIKLGLQIVLDTPKNAPKYVGGDMSCANCHLNAGQKDKAFPWVGIAAMFPEYSGRSGALRSLEDRIRGCFQRSENGTAPPYDSKELRAVAAYITWISAGQPMGETPPWRHQNTIPTAARIPIEKLDPKQGSQLYNQKCAACHGQDGQGVQLGNVKPGPLWGNGSWNDGAGAGRVYTLAGFIRYAMPYSDPGSLSDEEAQQIAAYIDSRDRPVFQNKQSDWPNGDVPSDAVYYPQVFPNGNPLRANR